MLARVLRHFLPVSFACVLLLLFPVSSRADGGAPQRAYIAGAGKGIGIIDVGQQKMIDSLNIEGDPHMILLSLDGRFLYVTQPQLGRVSVISAKTAETICSANVAGKPTLLALDVNANILFAAGNGASSAVSLDPTNCQTKRTFRVQGQVSGLAVAAVSTSPTINGGGNQIWIADDTSLTAFDEQSGKQIAAVPIPGGPQYLSIPPGATLYATTRDGSVVAVDINSYNVIKLVSGGVYGPMDFDETTGQVYVPDQQNKQLLVLDPVNSGFKAPSEPRRTIPLGVRPESIAITSDGQLGFAALAGGNVAMLDILAHQVITTVKVDGNPHFIITGLNPPLVATTPQQASIFGAIASVAAYIIVIALLIVPVVLFRRYAKLKKPNETEKDEEHTQDEVTAVTVQDHVQQGNAERQRRE